MRRESSREVVSLCLEHNRTLGPYFAFDLLPVGFGRGSASSDAALAAVDLADGDPCLLLFLAFALPPPGEAEAGRLLPTPAPLLLLAVPTPPGLLLQLASPAAAGIAEGDWTPG